MQQLCLRGDYFVVKIAYFVIHLLKLNSKINPIIGSSQGWKYIFASCVANEPSALLKDKIYCFISVEKKHVFNYIKRNPAPLLFRHESMCLCSNTENGTVSELHILSEPNLCCDSLENIKYLLHFFLLRVRNQN